MKPDAPVRPAGRTSVALIAAAIALAIIVLLKLAVYLALGAFR
jgi:hypothetical protein